jgi:hypothetical protein
MRSKVVDLEVPTIGTVKLRLFHACPAFCCGNVIGPGVFGYWWAERGLDSWLFTWALDNLTVRFALEEAIDLALPSPADLARLAQDARVEAPDA